MRAILINPEDRTVTEIQIKKGNNAIYAAIDCEAFECPITFDNNDTMYWDEDGVFKPQKGGITMEDWCVPVLGKILILGTNSRGNSVNAASKIEDIEKIITWVNEADAEKYRTQFN